MDSITLKGVTKAYRHGARTVDVLRGVDLEIRERDCLSITGASGSGKTTLLNLIGGLDCADGGEILWDGASWQGKSLGDLASWRATRIGYVFQTYHLLDELTVLENALLPASLVRRNRTREAKNLLESVGLSHRLDHRPYELSGGEQQRVVIARALINDPDLILADEPTGNLDSENTSRILKLLLDLTRESKKALVLVTHDAGVARSADRQVALVDGRIETDG
jgi:ABC-type lipoprotein export system ATPase subunit